MSMDAIAQFVACFAVAALFIMQHRRFTEVDERLAAISRTLEQSLAETRQQAKQVQKMMRTISMHEAKVSDRLGQIDARLDRFERDLWASRSADCAHQEFEDECFEGDFDFEEDKVQTWLATATRAKQEEQGSSSEKHRKALGSASTRKDALTSAQLTTRTAKMMNPRHDVCRHDVLGAGSISSANAASASMTVQNRPLKPDSRAERKVSREWRSHEALLSVAEEPKPCSSKFPPSFSRSFNCLPPSASSGALTRTNDTRDHQKSTNPDLGDGRRIDCKEAGRLPPAAPPNTPLRR